jgi:hypothetical protein
MFLNQFKRGSAMREQRQDEDRLEYLAKVLHIFVSTTNAGQCSVEYDGAIWDGKWLADDIIQELHKRKPIC